ncbi:hypothetical protein N7493_008145 [Penicillium malachiteum]|uniref:Uncharacterized protein n=1 Tax=Penicillium malachiteum TaxID=1324776 RepID=A0AAD6HH91_9EURO|nr:hypothetical protein N7493_008145 [Penicillium malachiteum]
MATFQSITIGCWTTWALVAYEMDETEPQWADLEARITAMRLAWGPNHVNKLQNYGYIVH